MGIWRVRMVINMAKSTLNDLRGKGLSGLGEGLIENCSGFIERGLLHLELGVVECRWDKGPRGPLPTTSSEVELMETRRLVALLHRSRDPTTSSEVELMETDSRLLQSNFLLAPNNFFGSRINGNSSLGNVYITSPIPTTSSEVELMETL